ncbi:heparan sulfate 2-O-sulfotransferase 1 [Daphnia magna]|nr:heparan sulfate 2-O-sulfotransferase 1 [Daphnia magna]
MKKNRRRWSLTSCSTTRERAYIFHSINRLYTFRTVLVFCLELYFFSWSSCSSAAVVLQTEDTPPAILLDASSLSHYYCCFSESVLEFKTFTKKAMILAFRRWCWNSRCESSPRRITPKNKFLPYVVSLVAMKLTVMMLLASNKRSHPQRMGALSADYSLTVTAVDTVGKDEMNNRRYWQMLENLEEAEIEGTATNRTHPSSIWLIYNRVPRCGGLTMVFLMKELAKVNRFAHQRHQYRTPWNRLLIEEEMKNLVTWFEYQHQAKSYDRHFLHVNFTRFQRYTKNLRPTYMNIVRDPAEREYSAFRGRRSQDPLQITQEIKRRDAAGAGTGMEWYTKSFDDCILDEDEECAFNSSEYTFSRAIPYFCGQDPRCLVPRSRWALQRAKFIIEHEYSVVGILDKMNETLHVLERYIPRFFSGSAKIYYSRGYGRRHENRYIKSKPALSDQVLAKLRDSLSDEYELYEFCQQRLYHQYQQTINTH